MIRIYFLTLHSNLLLCHRNLKEPNDAYELGWQIINTYGKDDDVNPKLLNKIKFNTILSIFSACENIQKLSHDNPVMERLSHLIKNTELTVEQHTSLSANHCDLLSKCEDSRKCEFSKR